MAQAQSSDPNFPETDFNLLEDSEDADNHTSSSTATRLSLQFQLDETYLGQRIDQVAATIWSDFSREKLKQWLKEGHLLVNGNSVKPKYKCEGFELLTLEVELEAQTRSLPEDIPLDIVYEDDDIIVVNKPVGMVVHPGAGNSSGTLVNALLHHYPKSAELTRAGLVHRIDKDTSGLLVVAKNLEAQFSLSKQLAKKTVYRVYDLIVYGNVIAGGTVDEPIKRHPVDRVKMAVLPGGKDAVTHYNVKERFQHFTRIQARLETGRTHQIRVHFSYIGFGLVGDPVYMPRVRVPAGATELLDETLRGFRRQALHAAELGLKHPRTGEEMLFKAPWPADLATLVDVLRTENKAY
ncbi:23S rRNA pseudouridine(1911/1915/1917) synthase RluD [Acinetobacter sp. MYb177]|jgi:23S rRNA pseudouridine1911/1915/1917 synthase|uniref:Pseudouridine synthase n=1 Tax=Acinetobacter johnsonii TaxID=40214 RepID=A0A2W5AFD3_ACIJO|nr:MULTISPECIES: 23S rRNA pseudouridine(1911/1915/1917) synthase RluD [Acinetobacter]MBJ7435034.1 23S rRNA pseudouridine(1911/1915/1917) synthase RluD [Acinetobacter sp.]MDN5444480.1 23S rRNA pseudouridine(1911/1915/1917) synthase RluD [Pseudomonadales bacterium]MBV7309822.1 23S rRNA pseudouridine(1911/1915/1917) synthase RluD [Acinetobacter sp. CWB-G5]MCS3525871.1 23S rRNA pseudouridine1911/1915/1917 synthase [Acinetobacter johnsonii]MDH0655148.1 23S rRNA pseudouridine(1911/1915/1917) synthas